MKFQVKRSEWFRGQSGTHSSLLRPTDNKMCCLGFLACSVGFLPNDLEDLSSPAQTVRTGLWPKGILTNEGPVVNSKTTEQIVYLNDSRYLSEELREHHLTVEFAKLDIEVEFVE